MTTKARLKFLLFVLGLSTAAPLAVIGVALLANFMAAFQQGADPASIFRGHTLVIPESDEARWVRAFATEGRQPSQAQQEEIVAAYWLAWEALNRALQTGSTEDLATYWAGAAYAQASAAVNPDAPRTQSTRRHRLVLRYFSADGSTAAFDDVGFVQSLGTDETALHWESTAAVVMTLDQGFWRVRSIRLSHEQR